MAQALAYQFADCMLLLTLATIMVVSQKNIDQNNTFKKYSLD